MESDINQGEQDACPERDIIICEVRVRGTIQQSTAESEAGGGGKEGMAIEDEAVLSPAELRC